MSVTLVGVAAVGVVAKVQSNNPSAGSTQYLVPGRGYLNDATTTDFEVANWGNAEGVASFLAIRSDNAVAISGVAATTSIAALSGGTFSRASIATYLDSGNVSLVTVDNDVLRPSYPGGVLAGPLIEAAATNIVTNNTGTGLVPGTPGTPPTNWTVTVGNGMSVQTVGSGVENGIAYVDIRWFGTAAGPATLTVVFDTSLTTTSGQTSTISLFARTLPGSVTAISNWTLDLTGATGAHLSTVGAPGSGGLASQRFSVSGTAASSGSITPQFALSSSNATTNDITIRLGLPQVELGSSATSPIATSSGAVTRAADTVSSGGIVVEMKPVTGVAGTGQVGSLKAEIDRAIIGVSAAGSVGTVTSEIDSSLTGVAATGNAGTANIEIDVSPTGVSSTTQVGTASIERDKAVTGVSAAGSVGTVTTRSDAAFTLTGVSSTAQVGTASIERDKAVTGVSAAGSVGTVTTRSDAAFTLTGVSSTGSVGILTPVRGVSILGVSASAHAGVATIERGQGIVGVQANSALGSPLPIVHPNAASVAIRGVSAAGRVGAFTPKVTVQINGVAAICQIGIPHPIDYVGTMGLSDLQCLSIPSDTTDIDVTMRWSDTRGASWQGSSVKSLGATGEYLTSMQWRRLGMGRDRIIELSWSAPVATALAGVTLRVEDAGT